MRGLCKFQTVTLVSHVLPRGDSEISLFRPWHVGDFHMSEGVMPYQSIRATCFIARILHSWYSGFLSLSHSLYWLTVFDWLVTPLEDDHENDKLASPSRQEN